LWKLILNLGKTMIYPHIVAYINSAVLIGAGLFSFFSNPERPLTALIGPAVGIIIALMAPAMKNGNKIIAHILVGITFIFAVQTGYMAFKSGSVDDAEKRNRRIAVFTIMSVASFGATGYYLARFIRIKQNSKLVS
jgi:hypothetical protein